jgi:hypothetical protein
MRASELLLAEALAAEAEAAILRARVAARVHALVHLASSFVNDDLHSLPREEDPEVLLGACALVRDLEKW